MANNNVIDIRNASLFYTPKHKNNGSNDIVLTDISVSVNSGELVYLIGKIGSGKSTLLKSIYGEVPLLQGEGTVVGYDLRRIKKKEIPYLRRKLGIVFQDFQLLPDRNVTENLRFVLKATGWKSTLEINQRIEEILNLVDLSHKAYKMPHHLSGGEQQRLVIGRALLNKPEIILADEPTGNLDPQSSVEVMNLFEEIKNMGCAVMIATHDISIIEKFPSRTLRFNQGGLQEIDIFSILGIENKPE